MSGEVDAMMTAAVQAHQAGNLVAAEEGYRRVVQRYPAHSNALMYLGVGHVCLALAARLVP